MSEDFLYLNVYTPCGEPADQLPVMVWLHGGGFTRGSGGTYFHGPEFLGRLLAATVRIKNNVKNL